MKIAIGSDHGGYELKKHLIGFLKRRGHIIGDLGTHSRTSCDYPRFAFKVGQAVAEGSFQRGIIICKSGIGSSIAANKVPAIRAALCMSAAMARASRQHNNANVLALGANYTSKKKSERIVNSWLKTGFTGGRHMRRINQISNFHRKLMQGTKK